jgi:hypothetical protein
VAIDPKTKQWRDHPKWRVAQRSESVKNNQQQNEADIAEKHRSWPKTHRGQERREVAHCDRGLKIPALLKTQVQQQQKDRVKNEEAQRLQPNQAKGSVRHVVGDFAQPLVIDPGVSSDRKRVHIRARKVVLLQQVLRVPHMPPDVRVVHVRPVKGEDELQSDKDKCQDGEE